MRITLLLHKFDRMRSDAYAILWLDREAEKWSREGRLGMQLPEWGTLRADAKGLLLCDKHRARPIFRLEGFAMETPTGPRRGQSGEALWCGSDPASSAAVAGHWRVQCVDDDDMNAEYSLFADDEDDPTRIRHEPDMESAGNWTAAQYERSNRSGTIRHERRPAG